MTKEEAMAILDAAADEHGWADIEGVGSRFTVFNKDHHGPDASDVETFPVAKYYFAKGIKGARAGRVFMRRLT